jgi:hypothetical protein
MIVFADCFEHPANLISGPEQTCWSQIPRREMPDRRGVQRSLFLFSISCFWKTNFVVKHMNIKCLLSQEGAKTRICHFFGCETVKL